MEEILKYFPNLSPRQQQQLAALMPLYQDWNAKINVISRKDIDNLYEHHVLHSLAIAKLLHFKPSTTILDVGTGGGFPGIPLAIMFPDCRLKLIDGTRKKVMVAAEVARAIGLDNVIAAQMRAEEERGKFDFVVSRAVMPLPELMKMVKKNLNKTSKNVLPNGVISLKGGDLTEELRPFRHFAEVAPVSTWFEEPWFQGKNVIYVPN